jgi:UDP-N-acetylglucosamine--N-acetylmuramyl-(pentapeptide) pyrophosphoryl-undecaprenol N-acetylglucosamine transferase
MWVKWKLSRSMKIIISGGGTGGHIYPAIAIADALKKRKPIIDILFVGAQGRMEMEKVPAAGYPIKGLWISGLQRRLTWKNVLFPIKVVHSLLKCRSIIREFKPDAVVGVGGYASGPLVRTAAGKGIPTVLLEQNSYPGMTNRMLAKKADKICVAYPGMQKYFPQEKIILTGNPIRASLGQSVSRQEAARVFGLDPQKKTILAMGGSLGARTINETITQSYDLIADRYDIQVLWQIGKLYATHYLDTPVAKLDHVRASVYIDRMDMAYAIADVVVARAGAMTISELCLTGKASILVPSPYVAEDHQTHNARSLVQEGAAILIPDSDAPREVIPAALRLLSQPDEILRMESQIRKLGKPQAADDIAGIIIRLANSTQQS